MVDRREIELRKNYERNFRRDDRHGPDDPLEYHLYHLTLYWSRLVGAARHLCPDPHIWNETGLARCVRLGHYFVEKSVKSGTPIARPWFEYLIKADFVSCTRATTLAEVEETVAMFERCLNAAKFDPWEY